MSRGCRRLVSIASILMACAGGLSTPTLFVVAFMSGPQMVALCPIQRREVSDIHHIFIGWTGEGGLQSVPRRRGDFFASPPDTTDDNEFEVVSLDEDDTISDKVWEEVEASAPSQFTVMTEVGNSVPLEELYWTRHNIRWY